MKITLGGGRLTPEKTAEICSGELCFYDGDDIAVESVATDSRECEPGTLFLAIRGERTDGHIYIPIAAAKGAVCALVEYIPEGGSPIPLIKVDSVPAALEALARAYREGVNTAVVAVTGSVGKTTTKEFISATLGYGHKIYRTEGNFNSVIGMPMSLLAMPSDTEFAVFEMGMSGRGEIESMSRAARPDIGVITNIGSSHLEYLGSRENIAAAKLEIVSGMSPEGHLLLCGGEPLLKTPPKGVKSEYFSASEEDNEYYAYNIRSGREESRFDARIGDKVLEGLRIPAVGEHNVLAALSAAAVGYLLGLTEEEIRSGIMSFKQVGLRQRFEDVGGVTLIEDCYNAAPESMKAGCRVLCETARQSGGRRIALLGDMLELGSASESLHRGVGSFFAENGVDAIFTFGPRALGIGRGAKASGMNEVFGYTDTDDVETVARALADYLRAGDVLLVKASRGIAAERVSARLKELLK